jgi:hypothetical protein
VPCAQLCIHHTEQLYEFDLETNPFRIKVSEAIVNDLDIDNEPPVLPLSVSIDGPAEVNQGALCEWSAVVDGGSGPTTYAWSGVLSGSTPSVSGTLQQSGWLYLSVTRGAEQESDQLYVTVDPEGHLPICPT